MARSFLDRDQRDQTVGEVRGPEANVLFTAMNTGHQGCMGTLHARSVHRVVDRVTTPPMSVPMGNMRGLDLLINQARRGGSGGGPQRACVEIAEVGGVHATARLQTLFRWDSMRRRLVRTSQTSRFRARLCDSARMSVMEFENAIQQRARLLEEALRTGATFDELLEMIRIMNDAGERTPT
jgi:flagellar protein FlaI